MRALALLVLLLLTLCAFVHGSEEAKQGSASEDHAADEKAAEKPKPKRVPGKKRTTKDWSKVDFNEIEKDWEKGDSADELEHEYENSQKVLKKKQQEGGGIAGGLKFDPNDPASIQKALKKGPKGMGSLGMAAQGASMVFVELQSTQQDGKPWDKESVDKLCSKWSALLKTAHLHANTFNLGEVEKKDSPRQVLVSIDKGWQAPDIFKFVLTQWETVKLTKDSKDYFAKDFKDILDDDDEL